LRASVVICAFTDQRWGDLVAAHESVRGQGNPVDEIIMVIDHNPELLARVRGAVPAATRVLANSGPQGLSGARNTGVAASCGDVVLFLDDDACADPDWAARTLACFQDEDVHGVGGWVQPRWDAPGRPAWFPETFLWTVGCSYLGLPTGTSSIRNPIGAAMAFRRSAFERVGGFSGQVGRIGSRPLGCEETEFSIRLRQAVPGARIVLEPTARVSHRVTGQRLRLSYFVRRCYYEGRSKRQVSRLVGGRDGLSAERDYVTRVLPAAVLGGLLSSLRTGRVAGALGAGAVLIGLAATAFGYLVGAVAGAGRRGGTA
jgi:GT2 family glycosyltransferase